MNFDEAHDMFRKDGAEAVYLATFPQWADGLNSLPPMMRGGLCRWIMFGIPAGDFLMSVVKNDLRCTFEYADDYNLPRIRDYLNFLYSYAPAQCWGGETKVRLWSGVYSHEEVK